MDTHTVKNIIIKTPKVRKVVEIEAVWRATEVAKYLGITRQHVYNLKKKGEIPYRYRAGILFFLPYEIYKWVGDGSGIKISQIRDNFTDKKKA